MGWDNSLFSAPKLFNPQDLKELLSRILRNILIACDPHSESLILLGIVPLFAISLFVEQQSTIVFTPNDPFRRFYTLPALANEFTFVPCRDPLVLFSHLFVRKAAADLTRLLDTLFTPTLSLEGNSSSMIALLSLAHYSASCPFVIPVSPDAHADFGTAFKRGDG